VKVHSFLYWLLVCQMKCSPKSTIFKAGRSRNPTYVNKMNYYSIYCLSEHNAHIQCLLLTSSPTNVTFQPENLTCMSFWHKGHKNIFGVCKILNFAFKSAVRTVVLLLRKITFWVQMFKEQSKNFVTEDRK
jgi:hypothetical protein